MRVCNVLTGLKMITAMSPTDPPSVSIGSVGHIVTDPADIDGGIHANFWHILSADSEKTSNDHPYDWMARKISDQLVLITEDFGDPTWQSQLELDVRMLWQVIYDTARQYADATSRNRLVVELMLIKGMGHIARDDAIYLNSLPFPRRAEVVVSGTTSDGYVFTDMPYFAHDMTRLWLRDRNTLSRQQRANLHWFLSTVCGIGLDDRICGIGLTVLCEARETLPPGEVSGLDEIAELWLTKARDRFKRLAEAEYAVVPPNTGELGPRAKEAGVPDNGGFSLERMHFWRFGMNNALPEPDHDDSRRQRLIDEIGEIPDDWDVDDFWPGDAPEPPLEERETRWYIELD